MLLLIPMYLYSGLTQCYIFGEFTAMFGVDSLSIAMVIFGFTNMSISYLFGKLSDKIGRIPIFLISFSGILIFIVNSESLASKFNPSLVKSNLIPLRIGIVVLVPIALLFHEFLQNDSSSYV